MSRIQIELPENFSFSTEIFIRITDINYGGHVGNDSILSILHEARMQYLRHHGYTEMQFEGVSMIMSDVSIQFKSEAFYGDVLKAEVQATEFTRAGFSIYYKLTKDGSVVAIAKTGMVCYDYSKKKIVSVPEKARSI
jgi:acyl-CoA thioester hydrolase